MNTGKAFAVCVFGLMGVVGRSPAIAQQVDAQQIAAQETGALPVKIVAPTRTFASAEEHFSHLMMTSRVTRHTYASVPKWEGLWSPNWNNIALWGTTSPFFVGPIPRSTAAGGQVAEGILTPEYQAAFRKRRDNMLVHGEQPYDRLTTCEAPGAVRWLLEPYVREFVNTPNQSWWMNDLANEIRRIYINQEHRNIDGGHSPGGDSIGFWTGNRLVVWTKDLWPGDYFRGYPPFSNRMEMIEVYELIKDLNGKPRLVAEVTFYDPISLRKPLNAVYTWTRATQHEEAGYRIRHWDCGTKVAVQDRAGTGTDIRLPGESGKSWLQMRAPDLPADLSGQTQSPDEVDFDLLLGEPDKQ